MEIEDLCLDDGTKKIFLNMDSKNGSKELISLLQYMKNTTLDNPEIVVRDERIVELDEIVTEVKCSEEWESVKMTIYDIAFENGLKDGQEKGIKDGMEKERESGIKALIMDYIEDGFSQERIISKLQKIYQLDVQKALEYYEKYSGN